MTTFEAMMQWLHADQTGSLVFDERPFVSYSAVVWKKPTGKVYSVRNATDIDEVYSGTMSVYFKCYEPFGKMAYTSYDTVDTDGAMKCCGILEKEEMPSPVLPQAGTYLVYNPGTEICNTVIRIAGTAPNGLTISNGTGDVCKLVSLPSSGYLE